MNEKEKDRYIKWLEGLCIVLLGKSNMSSHKKYENKLKEKGIDLSSGFGDFLYETWEEIMERDYLIKKFPLLRDYPGDILCAPPYDDYDSVSKKYTQEEKENIRNWEIKLAKKILQRLLDSKKGAYNFSEKEYCEFYNEELGTYEDYFLFSPAYRNLSPGNVGTYWSYRIDRSLPWYEDGNVAISVESLVEHSDYLNSENLTEFSHLTEEED